MPTRLESELREQGPVLASRTDPGWEHAARAAAVLRRGDVDHLVIAARGTSDNAARYAQYLLGTEARLLVGLAAPWLYAGERPPRLKHAAVLAISQSGRSPDVIAVVDAAREQDRPTIAVTNDLDSPLAAAAEVAVPLLAGEEHSVAATKTYLASLHALAQIAECLSPSAARRAWMARLPALVSAMVEGQLAGRARFDRVSGATLVTVVGRGLELATAHETALKVRELSGIGAEAFSPPDLAHGPIAALGPSAAFWLVSTEGRGQPDRADFQRLRGEAGLTIAVSDDEGVLAESDIGVAMEAGLPDWLAAIVAVIPGQAAALRLAELRGVDVDQPHGLRKVTLTR